MSAASPSRKSKSRSPVRKTEEPAVIFSGPVSVIINGVDILEVKNAGIPDPFGLFDLEQMLSKHNKKGRVLQAYIAGRQVDRRGDGVPVSAIGSSVIAVNMETTQAEAVDSTNIQEAPQQPADVPKGKKNNRKSKSKEREEPLKAVVKSFDIEFLKKHGLGPVIGSSTKDEVIREKLIEHIRTFNQLRELEDKNLENNNNIKYAARDEFFKKTKERLLKDDIGGYIYQTVKGYDLEELIHTATDLEDKPMEIEDWVQLYKHLVDYFGD